MEFLNYYGDYSGKIKDLKSVPDDIRQKCRFYGQQASERILCPEQVFRGFLVSTLTCQDCHNTSSRHESFLDLSLPVTVEKPQPPIRRRSSPDDLTPKKDLIKKHLKQSSKKNNRSSSQEEESDADVEDNLSEDSAKKNGAKAKKSGDSVDNNGNIESSEKKDDDPENVNKDLNGKYFLK